MKKAWFAAMVAVLAVANLAAAQDRIAVAGDKVAIYNVAGDVRVEAGSGSNVVVEITRGGADSNRLEVNRQTEGGWQHVIVHYPDDRIVYRRLGRLSRSDFSVRDDGTFGMRNLDPELGAERINKGQGNVGGRRTRVAGSGRGLEAHADIRVLVPEGRSVAVHLGVGKITATNVKGGLQLDARSASVEARGLSGFARLDTGSGSVTLHESNGDFGLHTGSGSVDVSDVNHGSLIIDTGSGSVEGRNLDVRELHVETGSGGVTLDDVAAPAARVTTGSGGIRARRIASANFDMHTGSGGVRLELTSDVKLGRINTGSGSVTIVAPRELGAEITIDTGSGGIDIDAPGLMMLERRKSFLRARHGDGSGSLRVHTGSGGVSFRSL